MRLHLHVRNQQQAYCGDKKPAPANPQAPAKGFRALRSHPCGAFLFSTPPQLLHNSSTTPPRSRRASKVSSQALNTASYTPARKQRDSPITHSYFNLTIPAGATPITLPNRRGYLILLDLRLCNRLNKPITQRETSAKRQRETSAKINTKL